MTASRPTGRIQNIQALRGGAVLMVVLFHLAGMEKEFGGGERLLPRLAGSGRAGVDLFFVVSGFIMVTVTAGACGPQASFSTTAPRESTPSTGSTPPP